MTRECRLDALAGRRHACTTTCVFWEPGGAVLEGRCAFELVDLAGNPALVAELLSIRNTLQDGAASADESQARARYQRLLNESEE